MNDLTQLIPEYKKSQVLGVVSILFPQVEKSLSGIEIMSTENYNDLRTRRGVGCEPGYDTYFRLYPSPDAIPLSLLDKLVSTESDADTIERIIMNYLKREDSRGLPMVSHLLEELIARYTGRGAILPTQALLVAVFRVGEEVIAIHRHVSMMDLTPRAQIDFLVYSMLERLGSSEAGQHLIEAFENEKSPAFLADIYVSRGRELGVFETTSKERPCIGMQDFDRLGTILIQKIRTALGNGTLADAPFYFDIVRSWMHLSDSAEAKAWLETGYADNGEFMAKTCIGLVAYSIDEDGRHYTMETRPDPTIYNLELLRSAGRQHLEDGQLTKDQIDLITAVVNGCEQHLKFTRSGAIEDDTN